MKNIIITISSVLAIALMLVGGACTEAVQITTTNSPAQNAMKMIPADWNIFAYLDAKEMRADTYQSEGLSDLWDWGEEYLEALSTAAEVDPANWPLSMNNIDYLAISAGDILPQYNYNEPYSAPSFVFIIGGTFSSSAVGTYLDNFDINYPDEGMSFAQSTYNGTETWSPVVVDPYSQVDPDILLALIDGTSVAIAGNTDAVEDCIDVIKGSGDNDSMLSDQGVKDISTHLRESILTIIVDGDVVIPNYEDDPYYQDHPEYYEDLPNYPDSLNGTVGYGVSKANNTLQLELVAQMQNWSDWQDMVTEGLPAAEDLPNYFGLGNRLYPM
ncbi:MAG: hypothetical protein HN929_14065 [Chloroflexi bacterium]|nr:hypothetical protein [Chloroflexota bacterium]MBT7082561.1 hypothetical protein [Chloroflexota bacterium]MBT7289106.1 hypothetical protein [Chloroflexota bacterium]